MKSIKSNKRKKAQTKVSEKRLSKVTTIKLFKKTKSRLNKLKEYERESYDQVLRKILYILNVCRRNPNEAKSILEKIDKEFRIAFSNNE